MQTLTPRVYRGTVSIIHDILEIIMKHGDVSISFLIREANIPYVRLKPLIDKLAKSGYIRILEFSKRIVITKKGKQLLAQLKIVKKTLSDMGINV